MPWNIIVNDSKDMAVHAALLPTGEHGQILYFGGFSVNDTHLFDVETAQITDISAADSPGYNIFCSGHAFLADGRLLVAGGQLPALGNEQDEHQHGGMGGGGERRCTIYEPFKGIWRKPESVQLMHLDPAGNPNSGGRWYPTLTTLGNGEVLAVGGHPDVREVYPNLQNHRHSNNTPERYTPATNTWKLLADNPPTDNQTTANTEAAYDYQRNHLIPDGRIFFSSPVKGKNRFYDPFAGRFLNNPVIDLPSDNLYGKVAASFTSVLLPLLPQNSYLPRVLLMNGNTPERIDLDSSDPQWEDAAASLRDEQWGGKAPQRSYSCPVILPTGEIFFSGGTGKDGGDEVRQANAVREGEMYNPGINWETGQYEVNNESWQTVEAAVVARHYHSVALLMPNGAVWTAGSNGPSEQPGSDENRETRIETYEPAYFNMPGRPTITACPKNIGYGYSFDIKTPQANNIERVALIRCGSVTHSFNPDQRYVGLQFSVFQADTLRITTPYNPNVVPPGYYMLWIIDNQNRPCELAKFIRVSKQKLVISADISTYSVHEVEALGTPATFNNALYIVCDGFLPQEVTAPTITIRRSDNSKVSGMEAMLDAPKYEGDPQNKDIAQRIVYPVRIIFNSQKAFDEIPANDEFENIFFHAKMGDFTAQTSLVLSKNPNPRMSDGDPHWLSIDVRTFKTKPGEAFTGGVNHPSGNDAPYDYIQSLLQTYNTWTENGTHPFNSLPISLETNRLALYSEDAEGNSIYNYAVARVRFRAPEGINAADVKVFFRLWTTGWTALTYDTQGSYRRFGDGASATPLLGLTGGEINNVPCFAEARVADMEKQTDNTNQRTLEGAGEQEVYAYFGCWLDMNQEVKRFPLKPQNNGPYNGDLKSIQELMRGLHQCLVAEIHYTLDPIDPNATPGSSDNLAQRNILLDDSDNPGSFASHLVHHTFEIKPSSVPLIFNPGGGGAPVGSTASIHPDELVIDWGNLPRESHVTFYIPQINVDEVLQFASQRQSPGNLLKAGQHTIQCKVADVGYIPIPGSLDTNIVGLMSVQLPPSVTKGQKFTVVVRQVDGITRKIIGIFQFDIYVKVALEILPLFRRNLSVLKHIALSIPEENRWYPVFQRYISELGERVRALGDDPEKIYPTSTGSGSFPERPEPFPEHKHYTGKVYQIIYDCFGDFEGFVLYSCTHKYFFECKEKSMEAIVQRACCERIKLTVYVRGNDENKPFRIALHC
jgi:hypothetical protein